MHSKFEKKILMFQISFNATLSKYKHSYLKESINY